MSVILGRGVACVALRVEAANRDLESSLDVFISLRDLHNPFTNVDISSTFLTAMMRYWCSLQ